MPLETATYITDLAPANPAHTDGLSQADSHMRLIKQTLQTTFPALNAPLTRSASGGVGVLVGDGSGTFPSYAFSSNPFLGFWASNATAGYISFSGTLRGNGAVPAGMICDYAYVNPPTGWLACDGQAVSRTTYADLFAAIGTTWGNGDGSTTFNVPSFVSRFRRHRDNSTLSGVVGTLQSPQNLAHTHAVSGVTSTDSVDHSHTYSGTTSSMNRSNPHSHTYDKPNIVSSVTSGGAFTVGSVSAGTATSTADINHEHTFSGTTSGISAAHSHTFSVTSGGGSADNASEARPYCATVLTCIKV